ncbi:MAG: hypothetical protein EXR99_04940 [Gemmataceae bacterium]|nr:hypothetical protein [Gemmataceae bacterium]
MKVRTRQEKILGGLAILAIGLFLFLGLGILGERTRAAGPEGKTAAPPQNIPFPLPPELQGLDLNKQGDEEILAKSASCVACHENACDPHGKATVRLGCTDCHGGNANVQRSDGQTGYPDRPPYASRSCPAAPPAKKPGAWRNSANPIRSYTLLNQESPDYIRFVNPGDSRVSHISCGTVNCHGNIVNQVRKSMMTHGCMLWGSALYNNGSVPYKIPRHGELYSMHGEPLRIQSNPPPTEFEKTRGVIPFLDPLLRYEITQPGNILRIFERGGKIRQEVGIPNIFEDPGRPFLSRLSNRGLGTENRVDPVFIGLAKTRLFDPTLNFLGTNEQPGDFRSSGCTGCHMIYANDRSPVHSGPYAKFGNRGLAAKSAVNGIKPDPTIPKNEPGHPIQHRFASGNSIPISQCMTCHVHPGTTVMNTNIGYMWWDLESDAELMYPKQQKYPTAEQFIRARMANPEESSARGNWSDPEFLANLSDLNTQTKHSQFGDFHSHGWAFRAVFRRDHKGNILDYNGDIVKDLSSANMKKGVDLVADLRSPYKEPVKPGQEPADPAKVKMEMAHQRAGIPMHLVDIHVEKGLHCVDCHYLQDNHGNGRLQMEVRAAIEVACVDCHGNYTQRARLRTSGVASYSSNPDVKPEDVNNPLYGRDLTSLRTPSGKPRFERRGNKIFQRSLVEKDLIWEIVQTADTLDPQSPHYNAKSAIAKTVRRDGDKIVWGQITGKDDSGCAHSNKNMSCITCHSSWNASCYGCHLPQKANMKMPQLHSEGDVTRNYTDYNFQTLRDDVFMLARDGTSTGNKINPSRSSCAIHVTSYNQNRESIYVQQQTISGEGYSGIAFSTNVPHTFSSRATKQCADCHLSKDDDNNALITQLAMQGTNYLNFIGRYAWVGAGGHGLWGVVVTERDEPQAVIGSYLHKFAFPDFYREHMERRKGQLKYAHEHPGKDISDPLFRPFMKPEILSVQQRGEYLYAACGEGGFRIFDTSMIDHKGFSERIFTSPVSPIGQKFYIRSKYATCVASPTTIAPDPTRIHFPENQEGRVAGIYGLIFFTDKYEGLVAVGAGTLLDGDPLNNFIKRAWTFNPGNILVGANHVITVGNFVYVTCDAGLVVISLEDANKPVITSVIPNTTLKKPRSVQVQLRYGFVADQEGVKVLDVTDLARPKLVSQINIPDVRSIYVARTNAYLAAGKSGLIILDVQNPEKPKIEQIYNADGLISDANDIKLGITYTSQFAYLADGKNGLRVIQLTSPDTPGSGGFSPKSAPTLIATYKIPHGGEALCVSKGIDRDRAVDESGNQLAVFGRVGARPFTKAETEKLYMKNGKIWKVSNDPFWEGYQQEKPQGK